MKETTNWEYIPLEKAVDIFDALREPINNKERAKRIEGKPFNVLFPYYGATGLVGYIDDYILDGDYVLLGEDGAPFLSSSANKAYLISGKAWVNNHAHILKSKTNNKFLCYYLNYFNYKGYVSGTTRLKLTQASMKSIPVPVSTIEEQQRIVARIEELFSQLYKGVETLQTIKQQLAVYRQAVLKEAFEEVDGETTIIRNLCKDIKVGIVIKPTQYYVNSGGIYAFRNSNVRRGFIDDRKWAMISIDGHISNKRSEVHTGDVLISRSGANLGMASAIPEKYDGYNAIDVVIAVPDKDKIIPAYLAHYTNSPFGQVTVKERERGAAQAHLNVTVYGKLPIVCPSIETQRTIIKQIEERCSICDSIEQTVDAALAQAEALRQSILKKAFEGGFTQ